MEENFVEVHSMEQEIPNLDNNNSINIKEAYNNDTTRLVEGGSHMSD